MKRGRTSYPPAAKALAKRIQDERSRRGLTLQELSNETGIDVAQTSRLCRGQFVRLSKNLAKLCLFLQINPNQQYKQRPLPPAVSRRAGDLWHRSSQHRQALLDVLSAIERL